MAASERQHHQQRSRNAPYLSLACSLLGVVSGSSWERTTAFVAASHPRPDKTVIRKEQNSRVRLFSSLPLTSSKKSLQHPDQQASHQYPSQRNPDGRFQPSQLNSVATALAFDGYQASFFTDDPFDPYFGPPSWEDAWGPSPVAVSSADTATLPGDSALDSSSAQFRIFCDLDGVLCDFEHGVQTICRSSTSEIAKTTMWQTIAQSNCAFFEDLQWTRDGKRLWHAIRHLEPDILTGVPDLETARTEKFNWCRRHLGMGDYRHVDMAGRGYNHANVNGMSKTCKQKDGSTTNVITCWSYNKHHESGQYAVLIDDSYALKESWEAKGGIFVHHTDTDTTLQKLDQLGVLDQRPMP